MNSREVAAHVGAESRRRLSPADRRNELLALGAEVFGQRPYDEVRIDEIAERAGVSRALMYHYFPDKRAFFAAVVQAEGERLFEATSTPPGAWPKPVRPAARRRAGLPALRRGASARRVGGVHGPGPHRPGAARRRRCRQRPAGRTGSWAGSATSVSEPLDAKVERDLRATVYGWLALTFEMCRQRLKDPSIDAGLRRRQLCARPARRRRAGAGTAGRAGLRCRSRTPLTPTCRCRAAVWLGWPPRRSIRWPGSVR